MKLSLSCSYTDVAVFQYIWQGKIILAISVLHTSNSIVLSYIYHSLNPLNKFD